MCPPTAAPKELGRPPIPMSAVPQRRICAPQEGSVSDRCPHDPPPRTRSRARRPEECVFPPACTHSGSFPPRFPPCFLQYVFPHPHSLQYVFPSPFGRVLPADIAARFQRPPPSLPPSARARLMEEGTTVDACGSREPSFTRHVHRRPFRLPSSNSHTFAPHSSPHVRSR